MRQFRYRALPMRVVFGAGSVADLATEARALGLTRVLIVSGARQAQLADEVSRDLGPLSVGVHAEAVMHVPVEAAAAAIGVARSSAADGVAAIGGGSTVGLAKAIARELGIPIIAVPTSFAGSEMTSVWGETADGEKITGRDAKVLPASVLYDPALVMSLPVHLAVTSGFNAIAHAVEGLYAPDVSPVISLMAVEGIRAFVDALPRIAADPENPEPRSDALYGAWLCGSVLGATTMGLHHKLCHVLGGTFGLPHSETHTVLLPYVLAFNAPAIPDVMRTLRAATGFDDPAAGLRKLSLDLGAPATLWTLGLREGDIDRAAALATASAYSNPRVATAKDVRDILLAAVTGRRI
jgi:maleylacetate reductase